MRAHRLHPLWIALLVFSLVLPAYPASAQATLITDQSGGARDRMHVSLSAPPSGAGPVPLTFTATPALLAPDVQVTWMVDDNVVVGPLSLGAAAGGQLLQQSQSINLPGPGVHRLLVEATYLPAPAAQFGATNVLFASVAEDGAWTISTRDPNARNPMHSLMPMTVTDLAVAPAAADAPESPDAPNAPNGDPCYHVNGTVLREDRAPGISMRGAPTMAPVRNALVEMREEDVLFDDSYGKKITDDNGNFFFSFCDDDGVFDDEVELYVRLRAQILNGGPTGQTVVEVEDSSWIDEVYEFDSPIQEREESATLRFDFSLNTEQSSVFNIADAVFEAWKFWNASGGAQGDDATFRSAAEVHWEPGYGDTGSYYNGYVFDEITIADDASDPDEWDDAVIMHEWGHMADDHYGCDDNPGGKHFINKLVDDPELSWGEGYPDYWQSAVRASLPGTGPAARYYIDANAAGSSTISIDLENFNTSTGMVSLVSSSLNEMAVAAMLWDLNDSANDGQDRTGFGHRALQEVYTNSTFESNGDIFDDECTDAVYLISWREDGKATDAATAAAITQNIGLANPFGLAAAAHPIANQLASDGSVQASATNAINAFGAQDQYRWWQQVTMVADNSASMAASDKLGAVKTVMNEQVNDADQSGKGVEFSLYTFNNIANGAQEVTRGRFYPDSIAPFINGMATIGDADPDCMVNGFRAMSQAVSDKRNGEAWLYTDGDTIQYPSVESMKQLLNQRGMKGSFVLLGGCASAARSPNDVSGPELNYLGKAADGSQPGGIVPYLLTAIGSGGQFLFVNQSQLSDAGQILRAQLANSAGAGRWSDYVSDRPTYRWDYLTSYEYKWIDAPNTGTNQGSPYDGDVHIALPQAFPIFGAPRLYAHVDDDGYMSLDNSPTGGFTGEQNYYLLYVLDIDDFPWTYVSVCAPGEEGAPASPDCVGPTEHVYTKQEGEWFVIATQGRVSGQTVAFEALFSMQTGEIRYQYKNVSPALSGAADISLVHGNLSGIETDEVTVSDHDVNGAYDGMGYKFVAAPPQPDKFYTTTVDSTMSAVGFLLTGYSGDFDPVQITDPDGNVLSCDEGGALCLNLAPLVQYLQFNTNGRIGNWTARVSAGPSGQGTFSFTSMGASPIAVRSAGNHALPYGKTTDLVINLGMAAEQNSIQAWFQRPTGVPMAGAFTMTDNGDAGDGRANDGIFGIKDYSLPAIGVGYLNVLARVNGEEIRRTDPVPFNFQLLEVTGPATINYMGDGPLIIPYTFTNLDSVSHCYIGSDSIPEGWTLNGGVYIACLDPQQSATRNLSITPALAAAADSGTGGDVTVAFTEIDRGEINASAGTRITRFRPAFSVQIDNNFNSAYLRPNGTDTISLTVGVFDDQGFSVADGTQVDLQATLGTVNPATGFTSGGLVAFTFTSGTTEGDALITATSNGVNDTATIHIQNALPDTLRLAAAPTDLSKGGETSTVRATVLDAWGEPSAGQIVRLAVGDEGESGIFGAGEVITKTTNAAGQVTGNFTKAEDAVGLLHVGAQLLFDQQDGRGLQVVAEEQVTIKLSEGAGLDQSLYLPGILRQRPR